MTGGAEGWAAENIVGKEEKKKKKTGSGQVGGGGGGDRGLTSKARATW